MSDGSLQPEGRASVPTGALADIAAERQRQVEVEGWTTEHDDEHCYGELAKAAACYAAGQIVFAVSRDDWKEGGYRAVWPWDRLWWKPRTPRYDLVRAGALILAEIDRLDRAATPAPSQPGIGAADEPTPAMIAASQGEREADSVRYLNAVLELKEQLSATAQYQPVTIQNWAARALLNPALSAPQQAAPVADEFLAEEMVRDQHGPSYWRGLTDAGRAMYVRRFSDAMRRAEYARQALAQPADSSGGEG